MHEWVRWSKGETERLYSERYTIIRLLWGRQWRRQRRRWTKNQMQYDISVRLSHYTFTRMIIWFDSTVRANTFFLFSSFFLPFLFSSLSILFPQHGNLKNSEIAHLLLSFAIHLFQSFFLCVFLCFFYLYTYIFMVCFFYSASSW